MDGPERLVRNTYVPNESYHMDRASGEYQWKGPRFQMHRCKLWKAVIAKRPTNRMSTSDGRQGTRSRS